MAPDRLGVVAHKNNQISFFMIDLDVHLKIDEAAKIITDNTIYKDIFPLFFQTKPIVFTSKNGKGFHQFYFLKDPLPLEKFLIWAKAWGFNRPGRPELFPKSEKLSQLWLPNDPNENGGDLYVD